ncbi:MAG: hypothetical protein M1840_008539 [Geoglossum simile]|nr:MAG: hypothetical protein M1840_008539 [Geoglossum simile]
MKPQTRGRNGGHKNTDHSQHSWRTEHRSHGEYNGQGEQGNKSWSEIGTYGEHEVRSDEGHSTTRSIHDLKKIEILEPREWAPGRQEWMAMCTLTLVSLIVALEATILVSALPAIAYALDGSTTDVFWAATSYLLTSAVFQPLLSSLSDIFGRRNLLLSSLLLFTAGTLAAALSRSFGPLLIGRSLQGIGGGGIMALVQVMFADIVPLRRRANYASMIQMAWALGLVVGPLAGGLVVEKISWRWIFWIRLPLLGAALVMTVASMKPDTVVDSWGQKVRRIDWIVLGVVGLVATLTYERWWASNPFIKPLVFSHRSASAALGSAFMQGLVLYGILYYVPLFLESVKGLNAIMAGLGLFPITFTLVPSSAVVGVVISRSGKFLWIIWAGWAVAIFGAGLLLFLDVGIEAFNWILIFLFVGVGQGMLLSPINLAVQAACHTRDAEFAVAMFTFVRGLGICVGVALGGSVFQNALSAELKSAGLSSGIARNAAAYVVALSNMTLDSKKEISGAYGGAFATVFEVLAGVSLLGGVISLLIEPHSMNKELDTADVIRKERGVSQDVP